MELEAKVDVRGDKDYEAPELVRHGDIDDLTLGTTVTGNPVDCSSNIC
jgi:hypothetical protein